MKRLLVVGDIHGALKALQQALQRANVTTLDTLIFLGDYVDGWSESVEVVQYLISLSKSNMCIFLRGNHDDLCHTWIETESLPPLWLDHGGRETIAAYRKISEEEKKEHLLFYNAMIDYYIHEERLFVHAGFQNVNGPEKEHHKTAFYWDRTLWEMAIALDAQITPQDANFPKRLTHFKEIYIGHTPVTRIGKSIPHRAATVWNIDTGAAFKGTVSILDVNTKDFWQSDPAWQLYPGENGRN